MSFWKLKTGPVYVFNFHTFYICINLAKNPCLDEDWQLKNKFSAFFQIRQDRESGYWMLFPSMLCSINKKWGENKFQSDNSQLSEVTQLWYFPRVHPVHETIYHQAICLNCEIIFWYLIIDGAGRQGTRKQITIK